MVIIHYIVLKGEYIAVILDLRAIININPGVALMNGI
jgi:hypothetical protein